MASDAAVDARKRPLRRFPVLRAAGLEAGQASIAHLLTPFAVALPEGNARAEVRSDVSAVSLGPVSLVYARSTGAELSVQLTEQVSYYDINFALEGVNRIQDRDNLVVLSPRRAAVISPRMAPAMRLSDGYGQLHVRIERPALERCLERMLRRPVTSPVLFSMEMDLTAPAVASWAGVIRLLLRDLDEPSGLTGSGAVPGPWTDFLMTGLLLAQPHNYSDWLARGRPAVGRPPSLQRVIDLIEREPGADLSLTRLAAAGGMGPRALQRNFREYVGVSPREYVRWVRLGRARDDLTAGAGDTVAEIAFRWGFTHAPRFAGAYQDRYGEAPSTTLQAARTQSRNGSPRRLADRQGQSCPSSVVRDAGLRTGCPCPLALPARHRASEVCPWPRSATRPERSSSCTPTASACTRATPAPTCTTRAGSSAR